MASSVLEVAALVTRLAYRRLDVMRDEAFFTKLIAFIDENVGKKYELTMAGLLGRKQETATGYESFFCSELVAAAFKALDLLPANVPACQYWPGAFSQEKVLPLQLGATLGLEMVINFDLHSS